MRVNHQAFFCSLFVARLADQVLLFLVPLVVFQTTHQVSWSGLAFFIETLPRYLVFPFFGALCDRVSPLRLMRVSQAVRALACFGGVAAYGLSGGIGWLIALSAVCGVLTSQGFVAREVMLPQIFSTQQFQRVLAWSQLADQLGFVLGPMLAALLLGLWRWEWVVSATGVLFLCADGALLLWQRTSGFRTADPPPAAAGHWTLPVRIALRHVLMLPGLKKVVLLAAAENLVIGVTLATSAAMVTGFHAQSNHYYAALQTAGAVATVLILLTIARAAWTARTLGSVAFVSICAGGVIAGASAAPWGYALGFLLIVGFDKMFNVYIRSARQQLIPPQDYGKTTGVVILLNNLTQPLAGLLVSVFSTRTQTGPLIVILSLTMGGIGAVITIGAALARRKRALALWE
ncbi:major Facilitator Superfamily protein [Paraburkholderia xenovorans LB400]|uniref:Major facilitator superfamily (MFS) transporter n=1 Tax=Paraburkholderia xenovorans (strain LB400) TaxID=266265 RepID=Q142N6_PARXL|nr:MFS transporter [Paraburkholderia xenovorans]ABE29703.1 major facilitator superfamily (MFS) transporter [Paraburkholderia xenovorans LB400]AIP29867.1 major Facilitator Superfamily protein [Paraburkholderia xenovorans LB400]